MVNVKIGVIGIPGKWSTEILADHVERLTGFRLVIDMAHIHLDLVSNHLYFNDYDLCQLDALIVKKISAQYSPNTLDRLELLRIVEAAGTRIFSTPERIMRLINRLSCTITLRNAGIPMPPTVITEDIKAATDAVMAFGSAVFKPLYSTKAQGMCVIESGEREQIEEQVGKFHVNNPMMYIQQKVNLPGKDLGLVFLGGEYLGTYARISGGESWNTTIKEGGKYAAYTPSKELIELGQKAQSLFKMDFTTVDIAESDMGPIVFEVSAFGGFRGSMEGMGIDAAEHYANYVLDKINYD